MANARTHWIAVLLPPAVLMAMALAVATCGTDCSGPLWPDEPRYTNGAAMIHDWLLSGEILSPYEFAKRNYAQYPAFSIPFHPPVYPGLMALFFLVAGVSYQSARVFIGLCSGLMACLFYAVLRRGGVGRGGASLCAGLLLSTPEIALWSRSAMSEVPAALAMLTASAIFLHWFHNGRPVHCWLAFAVAGLAFLCRVTTAGVLPGWLLFVLLMGQGRRLLSWHVAAAAFLYFVVAAGYVGFAARFARYEVAADGRAGFWSWENLSYPTAALVPMLSWGTTILAAAGLLWCLRWGRRFPLGLFFLSWLASYAVFKLMVPTSPELRHFFGALPALAGLSAALFAHVAPGTFRAYVVSAAAGVAIAVNALHALPFPCGLFGYQAVGDRLAMLDRPGNVLLCCYQDCELMFRYRVADPCSPRAMLRGDRLLTIRLPEYAAVGAIPLVNDEQGMLEVMRRGRARYVVTSCLADDTGKEKYPEMVLAQRIASSNSDCFRLVERFPLLNQSQSNAAVQRREVSIWEYLGNLPKGASELSVQIPTAGMSLRPHLEQ